MNPLIKKNPYSPASRFWFDDFFTRDFDRFLQPATNASVAASANVWEDEKNLYMEFAMPGIKKEEVKVKIENNTLQVSAQTSGKTEEKEKTFIRKEFHTTAYTRSFRINEKRYHVNAVEAKLDNGILHLVIPKMVEEKKEQTVNVEVK